LPELSDRRVGILGGTFDPIHCGHIDMGRAAWNALGLTTLIAIPAHIPPHRDQPSASSHHRFAMVALAIAAESRWRVSDVELRTEAPSYTSDTLARFHERGYGASEMFFIIGTDAFADIARWKDYPLILSRASFAVVSRPGYSVTQLPERLPFLKPRMVQTPADITSQTEARVFLIDAPTANVSSTAIRQHRAAGRSIAGMVVPSVEQHIERHRLYTSVPPGRRASDRRSGPGGRQVA
jgi:nicotinate-nucleotide adenylyltransferase